jgi:hypothetical protein
MTDSCKKTTAGGGEDSIQKEPAADCLEGLVMVVLGPHVDPVLVPAGEGDGAHRAGDFQHQVAPLNVFHHVLPFLGPRFEPLQKPIPPPPPPHRTSLKHITFDYSIKIVNFNKYLTIFVGFPVFAVCAAPYPAAFFIVAARQLREDQSFNL